MVVWKTGFVGDELAYLAEAMSRQDIKGETWFLLALRKIPEERDKLREKMLSKNDSVLI
jgi:hypothetical protein